MAVWARVVGPLSGREPGTVELFGDHEAERWIGEGRIVECDPPRRTAVAEAPVERRAPAKKAARSTRARPMGTKDAP